MKKNKKIKIGITGGIGSGKSVLSSILKNKGFSVINVDELSKTILVADPKVKERIIKAFGKESYTGKEVNRKYLADKVFSDPAKVRIINSIVHPAVIKEVGTQMDTSLREHNIIFAEAALIYEAEMEYLFDYVVLVTADIGIRMKRKMQADGYTEKEFLSRDENQIRDEEKKKRADFIFVNNGSKFELKIKTELLIKILEGL